MLAGQFWLPRVSSGLSFRLPRTTDRHEDGILFASPELTSCLFEDDESYEFAVEKCGEFEGDLPQFSNSSQK